MGTYRVAPLAEHLKGVIESLRDINWVESTEKRYYIPSLPLNFNALAPAHLCAELDALTRTLSFTRLILEKLPPEQFCKIITKYDEINGIPPSPPESATRRISHAHEVVATSCR